MSEDAQDRESSEFLGGLPPDGWLLEGFRKTTDAGSTFWQAFDACGAARPRVQIEDGEGWSETDLSGGPRAEDTPDRRYSMAGKLGEGGTGVVFRAHDLDLGRDVAIKILRHPARLETSVTQRFFEEAQVVAQLQHPGIVPVFDVGLLADDRPFFAMRLVKGRTLARMLEERESGGPDTLLALLGIFEKVCQAVAYAHARDVVHRDLKPTNVMIGSFGEVQVMDWGLSKVLRHGGTADERAARAAEPVPVETVRVRDPLSDACQGMGVGTRAYMAPEQARGEVEGLAATSDVFSLGAILCEILTGRAPCGAPAGTPDKSSEACLEEAFERPESSGAPRELVDLARQCLAPRPQGRPRDASFVAAAVTGYLEGVAARAHEAEVEAARAQARAREVSRRVAHERRARRAGVALAVLVIAAVGGGGVFWGAVRSERAERRRRADGLVRAAITEVSGLLGSARRGGDGAAWERALDAAARARELAHDEEISAATSREAAALQSLVRAEAGAVRVREEERVRLEGLRHRLNETRARAGRDWDWSAQARAYAELFQELGVDLDRQDDDAVVGILSKSPLRAETVDGLEDWFRALKLSGQSPHVTKRVHGLLHLLEPDARTNEARHAVHRGDREKLTELATSRESPTFSPTVAEIIGTGLADAGATGTAITYLKRAVDVHPEDFWLHFELGRVARQANPPYPDLAIQENLTALALSPLSVGAWDNLGLSYQIAARFDEAEDAYRHAMRFAPDDPMAWINLAVMLHLDLGRNSEALSLVNHAVEVMPGRTDWRVLRARILRDLGRAKEGLTELRKLARDGDATRENAGQRPPGQFLEVLEELGHSLLLTGDSASAQKVWSEELELETKDPWRPYNMGVFCAECGRPDLARRYHEMALDRDPKHSPAMVNLGFLADERGQIDEAITWYRKALAACPNDRTALSNLGNLLRARHQLSEARTLLEKAVKAPPGLVTFRNRAVDPRAGLVKSWHNYGLVLRDLGDYEAALTAYRRVLELDPGNPATLLEMGYALEHLGRKEEAVSWYERVPEGSPSYALAQFNLGNACSRGGDHESALVHYERVTKVDPGDADALAKVAGSLARLGRQPEAARTFKDGLQRFPRSSFLHREYGVFLIGEQDYETAHRILTEARDIDATDRGTYLNIGHCLERMGRFEEARAAFRECIKVAVGPGDSTIRSKAWHSLSMIDQTLGRDADALSADREALKADPRNLDAMIDVAYSQRELGRYSLAETGFRRAEELGRAQGATWPFEQWIKETRRRAALDALVVRNLPAAVEGAKPEEVYALALVCAATDRPVAATELFHRILDKADANDAKLPAGTLLRAAAAACRASKGVRDRAGGVVPPADRAAVLSWARAWLGRSIDLLARKSPTTRGNTYEVIRSLKIRLLHAGLRALRDARDQATESAFDRARRKIAALGQRVGRRGKSQ